MSFTAPTVYSGMINALLKGHYDLLKRLNDNFEFEGGAQAGAYSTNVLTGITASDLVDGTMVQNGASNVLTALTVVNKQATVSLLPSQLRSAMKNARSMQKYLIAAADAIAQAAMNAIVAGFIAGTAGSQQTLASGNIDFASDYGDADIRSNLAKIAACLGYLRANRTDMSDDDLYALTTPTGYANLSVHAGSANFTNGLRKENGRLSYDGVPIYAVTGPSNWGSATKHAMIIAHRDSYALKFDGVYMHGDGWIAASDGYTKGIFVGPYAHGLSQGDLFAEIINPSS